MCFALPASSRKNGKPSRLPQPFRILVGGLLLVSILFVSLLVDRLLAGR